MANLESIKASLDKNGEVKLMKIFWKNHKVNGFLIGKMHPSSLMISQLIIFKLSYHSQSQEILFGVCYLKYKETFLI
jgi:hypothetical protein